MSLWWLLSILLAIIMIDADGGEGCWSTTGPVGLLSGGNQCGRRPRVAFGPNANPDRPTTRTTAKKRSYRRAVRRVSQHVLSVLKPTFWGGQTCPKWASGDTSLEALQHRGSKWLTLTISTSDSGLFNI